MFERIIIATDGSALSRKAVRHGIGLAAATDAELVALTVVPHYPVTFLGGLTLSPREMAGIEKRWPRKAKPSLTRFATRHKRKASRPRR